MPRWSQTGTIAKRNITNYFKNAEAGAGDGNRTRDLLITNQLLYH